MSEINNPKSPYYDPTLEFDAQFDLSERKYEGIGASDADRRQMEQFAEQWSVVMPAITHAEHRPAKPQNCARLERAYVNYWASQGFDGSVNITGILSDEVKPKYEWFDQEDAFGQTRRVRGERQNCFAGSVSYTMGRDFRDKPNRENAIYEPWNWDSGNPEFYPVAALVVLEGASEFADFEAYVHVFRHRDLRVVPQRTVQRGGQIVTYDAHSVPADYTYKGARGPEFYGVLRYFESADAGMEWLTEQRQAVYTLSTAMRTAHEPEPFPSDVTVDEVHGTRPRGTR